MIHFIKILEYDRKPNNKDEFDYLCAVTSQKIDPSTLKPKSLILDTPVVFHSPLIRAVDCLKIKENTHYIPIYSLKEIPFNMRKMFSKEEWLADGSALVRRKFKESFIKNQLMIDRNDIFEEIEKFLEGCYLLSKTSEISVVSHSFRLKIIEAFIKTRGRIKNNATLIHEYIHDNSKTFGFGKGFNVAENNFSFPIL